MKNKSIFNKGEVSEKGVFSKENPSGIYGKKHIIDTEVGSVGWGPLGEPQKIYVSVAERALNHAQGKVLTILEAVLVDKSQLKAVKDLIKSEFSDCHMAVSGIAYPDTRMMTDVEAEVTGAKVESGYIGA